MFLKVELINHIIQIVISRFCYCVRSIFVPSNFYFESLLYVLQIFNVIVYRQSNCQSLALNIKNVALVVAVASTAWIAVLASVLAATTPVLGISEFI